MKIILSLFLLLLSTYSNIHAQEFEVEGDALVQGDITVDTDLIFADASTDYVGINGTPTCRLEIFQEGQAVGRGLRFDDGTANLDWDITHGFGLRFHYGGILKGFIDVTTGAYVASSDRRLKKDITSLENVITKVKQLEPSQYRYKDNLGEQKSLGFIAQEVQSIFPELVSYSPADDLYGIDYGGFSVVAIQAIKEQQEVIEYQSNKINNLEQRLEKLESLLLDKN